MSQRKHLRDSSLCSQSSIGSNNGSVTGSKMSRSPVINHRVIPHQELHQKTYFNALEKMLIIPQTMRLAGGVKTTLDHQTKEFEEVFKKPPKDYDVNISQNAPFKSKRDGARDSMLVGASQTGNLGRSVVITGTADLTN